MRLATRGWAAGLLAACATLVPAFAFAGTFAVMSYNVKGIPFPIIGDRTDQIQDIAEKLEDFHTPAGPYVGMPSVVGLQEVFAPNYYYQLTNPLTVSYDWVTDKDESGDFGLGDGLTILSDFALDDLERTTWDDCHGSLDQDGSDCDTPKGFSFTEVTLEPGVVFHLYTLHADAGQDTLSQAARRSNITQLIEAINLDSPEGTAVVVLGDTNSLYTRVGNDNIQDLLSETGLRDVWVELRRGGVVPEAGPEIEADCETTPSTAACEEVDKIFYRDGAGLDFEPQSYQVLRSMFMGTMKPLSDHDPVAVELDYTVVASCGDPIPDSAESAVRSVVAGDALFVLRSAVDAAECRLCTCDVNGSASVSATDALVVLRYAVGQDVTLECPPCEGATTIP